MSLKENLKDAFDSIANADFARAKNLIDQLMSQNPDDAEVLFLSGFVEGELGNSALAIDLMKKSIAVKPEYRSYASLGDTYSKNGNAQEALAAYEGAIALDQSDAQVFKAAGVAAYHLGVADKTLQYLSKSLEINPNQLGVNKILGYIFYTNKHYLKALSYYQRELGLDPKSSEMNMLYGDCLHQLGYCAQGVESYAKGVELNPTKDNYDFLLYMMHHDYNSSEADLFRVAEECYQKGILPLKLGKDTPFYKKDKLNLDAGKKIRVGFISKYFKFKSAEYWVKDTLCGFDKDKFEIYMYHDDGFEDEVTQMFKDASDKWTNVLGKNAEEVAKIVAEDELDIFVDLVGHVKGNRLDVFLLKPAPVQISWLHSFGTTGMPEIDYLFTDQISISEENEKYFTEQIYRLPRIYYTYEPKLFDAKICDEVPSKSNGYITFGCLNRFAKLNNRVLDLWARVLQAVDNSRLYLSAAVFAEPEMKQQTVDYFVQKGIAAERIVLHGYPELERFFDMHNEIDIMLDPFPYTGGTTTLDSLWMGVPVVSLHCDRWVGKFGDHINSTIGARELVTFSEDEYINKAKELAADSEALAKYRKELRGMLHNSDFFNGKQLALDMEAAFQEIWAKFCKEAD